ncbi:hypothetical protein PaG_05523 [Moesziomyces aphidis]|uniref:Complex III subunit 9 n=1 Tax=Moesziomyces aphidis TaxID=84754 RepID=W3VHR1_MOEAP|nr:hypothetical protein PaG_05523 [Moesziomyces aphidis]
MSLAKSVYNTVFKRNSVYVGSIFFGAFAFGIGYDLATTAWWDAHNKGVSLASPLPHTTAQPTQQPLTHTHPCSSSSIPKRQQKQWKDIRGKFLEDSE